jgi:hypothetical protein
LTRPHATRDDAKVLFTYFFDSPIQAMIDTRFSSKLLKRFSAEINLSICKSLNPFPELVAVAQTERLLASVGDPSQVQPHATYIEGVTPGKLLYLTFAVFRGIRYLSSISEVKKEAPQNSNLFRISGSSLVVCRDDFAILDLWCPDSKVVLEKDWKDSAYYSIADLGNNDSKGSAFLAYSDVSRTLWNLPTALTYPGTVS